MQAIDNQKIQQIVMKEEIRFYNTLVYSCFKECVKSMASQKLLPAESDCLENCYKKTFTSYQRLTEALNYANAVRIQQKP
jgi:Tim10/DDP family zinc finger